MKQARESSITGVFEKISHNRLTKIKKHCLFNIDFQKKKQKRKKFSLLLIPFF